jgi:hypothetical protein
MPQEQGIGISSTLFTGVIHLKERWGDTEIGRWGIEEKSYSGLRNLTTKTAGQRA